MTGPAGRTQLRGRACIWLEPGASWQGSWGLRLLARMSPP